MKKSIYTIVASLCLINVSNAQVSQTKSDTDLCFGLKAGLNVSNVYDTKGDDFVATGAFGFAGGGFVTIPLGEYFAVQPEVLFSRKGFKGTGTILGSSYSYERTTNFLDVPILAAFRPIKFVSVVFGPQFSFFVKRKK